MKCLSFQVSAQWWYELQSHQRFPWTPYGLTGQYDAGASLSWRVINGEWYSNECYDHNGHHQSSCNVPSAHGIRGKAFEVKLQSHHGSWNWFGALSFVCSPMPEGAATGWDTQHHDEEEDEDLSFIGCLNDKCPNMMAFSNNPAFSAKMADPKWLNDSAFVLEVVKSDAAFQNQIACSCKECGDELRKSGWPVAEVVCEQIVPGGGASNNESAYNQGGNTHGGATYGGATGTTGGDTYGGANTNGMTSGSSNPSGNGGSMGGMGDAPPAVGDNNAIDYSAIACLDKSKCEFVSRHPLVCLSVESRSNVFFSFFQIVT